MAPIPKSRGIGGDAGYAVLDAVIGAALASLFALALMGAVRHLTFVSAKMEMRDACWRWAQAIIETYPGGEDASTTVAGLTPDGRFTWNVVTTQDEFDPSLERVDVQVRSEAGDVEASISTRRHRD